MAVSVLKQLFAFLLSDHSLNDSHHTQYSRHLESNLIESEKNYLNVTVWGDTLSTQIKYVVNIINAFYIGHTV